MNTPTTVVAALRAAYAAIVAPDRVTVLAAPEEINWRLTVLLVTTVLAEYLADNLKGTRR